MAAPHLTEADPVSLGEAKRALRRRMSALRRDDGPTEKLIEALRATVALHAGEVVAGTWPLPGEPDLRPLWHILHRRGHPVLLPVTPKSGEALRFRPWHPGCSMIAGRLATSHPEFGPDGVPDLLFVPLLAFDRRGYRLGYGGGYYDRTLARLPLVRAIGYGFAFQQVEAVPRGPHDVPLSGIVTEHGRVQIER